MAVKTGHSFLVMQANDDFTELTPIASPDDKDEANEVAVQAAENDPTGVVFIIPVEWVRADAGEGPF